MSMRIAIRCNNRFWCSDDDGVEGNSGWYSDSGISTFTIDELPAVLKEIDVDCCGVIELVPVYFPDTEPVAAVLPIEPNTSDEQTEQPVDLRTLVENDRVRCKDGSIGVYRFNDAHVNYPHVINFKGFGDLSFTDNGSFYSHGDKSRLDIVEVLS